MQFTVDIPDDSEFQAPFNCFNHCSFTGASERVDGEEHDIDSSLVCKVSEGRLHSTRNHTFCVDILDQCARAATCEPRKIFRPGPAKNLSSIFVCHHKRGEVPGDPLGNCFHDANFRSIRWAKLPLLHTRRYAV